MNNKQIKKAYFIFFFFFIFNLNTEYPNVKLNLNNALLKPSVIISPDYDYNFTYYSAGNILKLNITSDVIVDLNFSIDSLSWLVFGSKQLKMEINNSEFNHPLEMNFTALLNWSNYINNFPNITKYNNYLLDFQYNSVYKLITNDTISRLTFSFIKIPIFGLDQGDQYSIGYYTNQSDLKLIDTIEIEGIGYNFLEGSIENLQSNTDYYITIFKIEKIIPVGLDLPLIITLSILIPISIFSAIYIISVISKRDYINKLKKRPQLFPTGVHRLSIDEVLENENRSKIIDLILKNPGIHFSELLRKTDLASGNLVWHLEILDTYKIIKKETMESYVLYFPYLDKNPISNIDLKLRKSELTLKSLKKIEEEPGIWNNKLAHSLQINRKTIEYHIKKLIDLELIYIKKEGNINRLFPNLEAEYFDNKNNNNP